MGKDQKILIVEDRKDWVAEFEELLLNDGYTQIVIAHDKVQAMKALKLHHYELVILDLNLLPIAQPWEQYEGIAIVKELAKWPAKSRPAIIVVSGYLNQDTENFLKQQDIIAILRKEKLKDYDFQQAVREGMRLRGKNDNQLQNTCCRRP